MVLRLNTADDEFDQQFAAFLNSKRESSPDVENVVREILEDVRSRGDTAILDYTERFDHLSLSASDLRIDASTIQQAVNNVPEDVRMAAEFAAERIMVYHQKQLPEDVGFKDEWGNKLGYRWTAVQAAGLYVPGGTAAYPSSVLMNAIPAKVAGVEKLVMTVPTPNGVINDLVLLAAHLSGIDEIYRVGGAQAIAGLAYGTATLPKVDVIVGPGNAYVAAAKRQVFGQVGIDMIAGPSEVLIIADADNNAEWIAADLLAQAEHDVSAQSILITDSEDLADRVSAAVDGQLDTLPRGEIAAKSWRDFGAIILVDDFEKACELSDRIAPEHLEIATQNADELTHRIRNAGAIFIGKHTPEAVADYVAGSNHVLPTARSARFASGLSVFDFMKRTSILKCSPQGLDQLANAAIVLAQAEGLDGHAQSIQIRQVNTK